jgi:hypothetical protein
MADPTLRFPGHVPPNAGTGRLYPTLCSPVQALVPGALRPTRGAPAPNATGRNLCADRPFLRTPRCPRTRSISASIDIRASQVSPSIEGAVTPPDLLVSHRKHLQGADQVCEILEHGRLRSPDARHQRQVVLKSERSYEAAMEQPQASCAASVISSVGSRRRGAPPRFGRRFFAPSRGMRPQCREVVSPSRDRRRAQGIDERAMRLHDVGFSAPEST